MVSVSFADLVFDKIFSFSSKMKENSFKQGGSLCLMGDNPNFFPQLTGELLDDFLGSGVFPLNFDSVQRTKVDHPLLKNREYCSNKFNFSPHLLDVVNDSMRYYKQDSLLIQNNLNIANMCDLALIKPPPALQNSCLTSKLDPVVKKSKPTEQQTIKMSVDVKVKPDVENYKFNVPNGLTMNLELTNRKTKELQKRSKKRRRRQKKCQHVDVRTSTSKDTVDNKLPTSPKSSELCSYSKSEQFIVTVKQHVHMAPSLSSQFVISVSGLSDDDSDWDSGSESGILTETADFEFVGLLVPNLSAPKNCFYPQKTFDVECTIVPYSHEEAEEVAKLEAALLQVNKDWNESMKGVAVEPKLPSKVSFASDDKLEEVLLVETCDRKGEWELFAHERLRFKRRIDELEKVISPCLTAKHRLEIYNKLVLSEL